MFLSTISILFFEDNHHVTRVLSLCSIGFIVAIVWILTIVNEVVAVLQVRDGARMAVCVCGSVEFNWLKSAECASFFSESSS